MRKNKTMRVAAFGIALLTLVLAATRPWEGSDSQTAAFSEADQTVTTGAARASGSSADEVAGISQTAEGTSDSATPARADAADSTSDPATSDPATSGAVAQDDDGDASASQAAAAADGDVTLTLLHNNDGESKLLANADGGFPGIARFAQSWVGLGQASDADILLRVSSGDNFLASREFAAGLARDGEPLYDSLALRGLYEAMSFGNHDFDFGPDVTARFIDGLQLDTDERSAPFVAANIDVSGEPTLQALADQGIIAPSTVYVDPASNQAVGVIGALTPRLANISSPRNVVVDPDIAAAVNAEAAKLEEQGVNRIVLISHLQGLGEDRALVPQLKGVDIVVAGGGDELLKNEGDSCQPDEQAAGDYPLLLVDADGIDVPVVTAPGGYRCIGQLDVTFDALGQIRSVSGASIGVALDGPQESFSLSRVEQPLVEALAELDANVIGTSEVDLDGRRSTVRTSGRNVGELLADSLLAAGQAAPDFGGNAPNVAIQNAGGIRNDTVINAGDITESDTFDIAPFANFVVSGDISRPRFKELLEVAVAGLPDAQGTFPQIAGFTMDIDAARGPRLVESSGDCSAIFDAGSRVRNVTLDDGTQIVRDGQVVPGDDLTLATIDFLANGGDCYPLGDLNFVKVGASYQQALEQFVADDLGGTISATDYPIAGSRITIANRNADQTAAEDDVASDTEASSADTSAADTSAADDAADDAETAATATDEADDELARTGAGAWLGLIIALTAAIAGLLIVAEARRAGWLSLANRLSATGTWRSNEDQD